MTCTRVSNMSACIDVMSICKLAGEYNSDIRVPAGKQVALGRPALIIKSA